MKKIIIMAITLVGLSSATASGNRFQQMEVYREIQRLMNVEGKKRSALDLAKNLSAQLSQDDDLYKDVSLLIRSLGDGNPGFPLQKAVKFATGQKEEIYCKGVGLVFIEARHNDGTESTVKLISSSRELGGSYNLVKSGDWIYELDTEYREPVTSESWLDDSTKSSYQMREYRRGEKGHFDKGKWVAHWQGNSTSTNFSTSGQTPEPLPMFLANDFHLWGAHDLGFKLKFKVGYTDSVRGREGGSTKTILLATKRKVSEKLSEFMYKDANGKSYRHKDCYKVILDINLDRFEENSFQRSTKKKSDL